VVNRSTRYTEVGSRGDATVAKSLHGVTAHNAIIDQSIGSQFGKVNCPWQGAATPKRVFATAAETRRKEKQMRLQGKNALITGGNSGIGLATARLFAAEGARVAITGRNQETLNAAIKELGPNALAIKADSTNFDDIQKMAATVGEEFQALMSFSQTPE
jgi:NADPH:quinone reductase-like Zn-dependent oxidoreductase